MVEQLTVVDPQSRLGNFAGRAERCGDASRRRGPSGRAGPGLTRRWPKPRPWTARSELVGSVRRLVGPRVDERVLTDEATALSETPLQD